MTVSGKGENGVMGAGWRFSQGHCCRYGDAHQVSCTTPYGALGRVCISADKPPLSLREQCLSLWDWNSSRSDKYCLRSKREGGEGRDKRTPHDNIH